MNTIHCLDLKRLEEKVMTGVIGGDLVGTIVPPKPPFTIPAAAPIPVISPVIPTAAPIPSISPIVPAAAPIPVIKPIIPEAAPIPVIPSLFPKPVPPRRGTVR